MRIQKIIVFLLQHFWLLYEYFSQGIEFLLGLNFSTTPLKIFEARIDNKDYTDLVRTNFVKRGCSLFICDFKEDFGLDNYSGTFSLRFTFGEGNPTFLVKHIIGDSWNASQFVLTYIQFGEMNFRTVTPM